MRARIGEQVFERLLHAVRVHIDDEFIWYLDRNGGLRGTEGIGGVAHQLGHIDRLSTEL
jgi:hypothetical protein